MNQDIRVPAALATSFNQIEHTCHMAAVNAFLNTLRYANQLCTYESMGRILGGVYQRDPKLQLWLNETVEEDFAKSQPIRATLVINKKLGMPGERYYETLRRLGVTIPMTKQDEYVYWEKQCVKLGVFDVTMLPV